MTTSLNTNFDFPVFADVTTLHGKSFTFCDEQRNLHL